MSLLALVGATGAAVSGDATLPGTPAVLTLGATPPAVAGGGGGVTAPPAVLNLATVAPGTIIAQNPLAVPAVLSLSVPVPVVGATADTVVAPPAVLTLTANAPVPGGGIPPVLPGEEWRQGFLVSTTTGALIVTTTLAGAQFQDGFLRDLAGRLVVIYE